MPASYWSGTVLKTVLSNVTDVQTVIDELVLQWTSTLPAAERWTDLGGGEYKTPVEADGAFMQVTISRVSATRMQILVKDQNLTTMRDGRFDIASGDTVRVYSGPRHFAISATPGTTYKAAWASLVDPSPEPLNAHAFRVTCWVPLNSGGAGTGSNEWDYMFMNDNGTITARRRVVRLNGYSLECQMQSVDGGEMSSYVPVWRTDATSYPKYCGCLNNFANVSTARADNATVKVPTDPGVVSDFDVLPLAENGHMKMAVRIQ